MVLRLRSRLRRVGFRVLSGLLERCDVGRELLFDAYARGFSTGLSIGSPRLRTYEDDFPSQAAKWAEDNGWMPATVARKLRTSIRPAG